MLPNAQITFENGNIGGVVQTSDGLFGLLAEAKKVNADADKKITGFNLGTTYSVKNMADVAELGITSDKSDVNKALYKALKEFYQEAPTGTKLYLMGVDTTTSGAGQPDHSEVSKWFDKSSGPAKKLLDDAQGEISGLFTCSSKATVVDPKDNDDKDAPNGLDADVIEAKVAAQALAVDYSAVNGAPLFVILEGYGFTNEGDIDLLEDLTKETNNRVGVFIGNTSKEVINADDSKSPIYNASSGILMGRLSKIGVHEHPGKVKDGALAISSAFVGSTPVEDADIETLHERGYLTFRSHIRKAGYFIADDTLAAGTSDDYRFITRRRVIDKAYRIAHEVLVEEINNDVNLNNDGTISPYYAKFIEGKVENAIYNAMTRNGELSSIPDDKDDLGVIATVDLTNDVSANSTIYMDLKVRPKGVARYFEVSLGFNIEQN